MELAGLKVVMEADFDAVYSGFKVSESMAQEFAKTIKAAFNGIPDFGKKFNFTSNGASQAAQDAREYARAKREEAAANLDAAKAADIAAKAEERKNKKDREAKDLYGQLVAENQALVREYYNAAAAQIKFGDASGITAAKLEELRQKAKAGQDQLQAIEQGAGRFQRNVGNYASGFNPLNNSINQLTREFPAFANSVQTGLLGISNNIAPLADAIQQITRQQKLAKAEADAMVLAKYKQAESAAIAAGATKSEAKEAGKLAAIMAIATPEQLKMAAAARLSAEGSALAAGATAAQAKAAGDLAAKQALANVQTAASPGVLKALTAAIFSWQTALSIGVTLLTVYGPKLFQMAKGVDKATESQKKYTEALNEASKSSQVNALEEVNKLTILTRIAQDNNQKLSERKKAVDELRTIAPAYFKDLSDEAILYGDVSGAVRLATSAILQNAKAKAFAGQADVAAKKYVDEYDALNKATDASAKYYAQNEKAIKQQEKNAATTAAQSSNARSAGITQTAQLSKYISLEKEREEALKKTLAAQSDILKFQKLASDNTIDVKDAFGGGGGKEKAVKDVRDATDAYQELIKRNQIADAELLAGAASFQDTLKKKISNYKSYIVELTTTKLGLNLDSSSVNEALGEIEKLSNELAKVSNLDPLQDQKFNDEKYIQLSKSIKTFATSSISDFKAFRLAIDEGLNAQRLKKFEDEISVIFRGINNTISETLSQTTVLVAEGIGNILGGTAGIGDLFKSIGQFLGDQIIAFGKQLILAGGLMQTALTAVKALGLTPVLSIIAGGAAVALGATLKAALSKQAKGVGRTKFADGGVVYGPTNALVGEYQGARSNPEVIAPLDKLTSILRGQNIGNNESSVFIPNITIKGQDLLVVFKRAEKGYKR